VTLPYQESDHRRAKKMLSIGQAMDMSPLLKRLGLGDGDRQMDIFRRWSDIVGDAVARNTQPTKFSRGVLTVSVSSPAWLHNLSMMKPQILANLKRELQSSAVKDVKFRAADFDLGKLKP
jgi:predicted nucleic acid-binding Zn ribbon protein